MKRIFIAFLLMGLLPLAAQESNKQDAPPRFAIYSMGLLAENSTKAKNILADLETTKKNLGDKLKAKDDEVRKLQQQLQASSITDQAREDLQKRLRDSEFEFKKLQDDSQNEYNKVHQKVLGQLDQLVGPIIEALAKEQHLQVVFFGDAMQQGQMIYWADESWFKTFTLEVAKRLDASNGVAAPKPKPTQPKPAAPSAKPPVPKP